MEKKILYNGGQGEVAEKKSRFIATTYPVKTEEEALKFIGEIKKKYWDARHNCFAFVCGENNELQRFSDDGEPGGTAGRPILEVLLKEGIHDALIVVTRYFGGVLLGAGGLVRAYSKSAKVGLEASILAVKRKGRVVEIVTSYQDHGKFKNALELGRQSVLNTEFTESVSLKLMVEVDKIQEIEALAANLSNGKAQITIGENCWFVAVDDRIELL
ncbi:putative YigZ family protein [Lachnospiraceae bacterium PF1-22]|uniref:YigZ family protein n=1 Tax=Ohessyouella blattaphilus TaxID=2949333 RepID=UPI002569F79C|nr:YigZ family protein [Lachnospiraceae bacterium OttesenSCG-928-J05]